MRTKAQYAVIKAKRYADLKQSPRMRNPSKMTAKRIMRRAWAAHYFDFWQWNIGDEQNYFLFNWVGARLYTVSKGRICNREPKGYERYCFDRRVVRPGSITWNIPLLLEELRKHGPVDPSFFKPIDRTFQPVGGIAPIGNIGDVIELPKPNWAWMFRWGAPIKGMNFAMSCLIP